MNSVYTIKGEQTKVHMSSSQSTRKLLRIQEKMMQHKRSPISVNQSSFMDLIPKRLKPDVPVSSKEKQEKVSEWISALQQLVSPYGKTDAASVLLEAMDYINLLREQVKGQEPCSLRSKGLGLVPISFTVGVASSNGADIWAPIKTSPPNSRRLSSDETSVITYS